MRPNLVLLAGCLLTGGIALGTGCAWLAITGSTALTVPAVVVCAFLSVALFMAAEHAVLAVCRRRTRPGPSRHRKPAA